MTPNDGDRPSPAAGRRRALLERVAVTPGAAPVAYVRDRLLVRGDAVARVKDPGLRPEPDRDHPSPPPGDPKPDRGGWTPMPVADSLTVLEVLRSEGLDAQLDHVFFAHGCDPCAAAPHPAALFGWDDPEIRANPLRGNPLRGNPLRGNPLRGNDAGGAMMNSARPAPDRVLPLRHLDGPGTHPRITVLDTGIAGGAAAGGNAGDAAQCPPLLDPAGPAAGRITGDADHPDCDIDIAGDGGTTTYAADGWLNPVAGHGTFIAGLIEQLAPGCTITVTRVIGPLGDAIESAVATAIDAAVDAPQPPDILSLSFGGSVLGSAGVLRGAVARARLAGIVVVASAGNDGTPVPQYPAAFDHVIAVGALGPDGPAPWSNYGGWVDACAPGVALTSAFFADFDGPAPMVNGTDTDAFAAWATWSGTSFAAPVVVAALAREMVLGECGAPEAVERVVHAEHLLRIPCLGTVVNL